MINGFDDEIEDSPEFCGLYRSPCNCACRAETKTLLSQVTELDARVSRLENRICREVRNRPAEETN